jgi:hypothetical protein
MFEDRQISGIPQDRIAPSESVSISTRGGRLDIPYKGKYSFEDLTAPGKAGRLQIKTRITVKKWYSEEDMKSGKEPYDTRETDGNTGTNLGIQHTLNILGGLSASNAWTNALSYIGVCDGTGADSATATGLYPSGTSATAIEFHGMTDSYPSRSSQTLSYRSTFGATEANFGWNSFSVHNATYNTDATGLPLIRKLSQQGTKLSGQAWQITVAITMA